MKKIKLLNLVIQILKILQVKSEYKLKIYYKKYFNIL